ncbi:MAG: hypothetical protein JWP35_1709 [Caulobacter sp.]|nr:hypothetical protein [Caulobacter sp.]
MTSLNFVPLSDRPSAVVMLSKLTKLYPGPWNTTEASPPLKLAGKTTVSKPFEVLMV